MNKISSHQLHDRLRSGEDWVVINVLPRKSYEKLRIRGSLHASRYEEDFLEQVGDLVPDKSDPVVVYCNSATCNASSLAARELQEAGYSRVYELEQGVAGWLDAGLPVERR